MVIKAPVKNWHRQEFAKGNKVGIPPEALAILEAEAAEQKKSQGKKEQPKVTEAE